MLFLCNVHSGELFIYCSLSGFSEIFLQFPSFSAVLNGSKGKDLSPYLGQKHKAEGVVPPLHLTFRVCVVVVAGKAGGVPQVGDKRIWWGLSGQSPLATTLCQSHPLFFPNWEALHFAFILYRILLLKSKWRWKVWTKAGHWWRKTKRLCSCLPSTSHAHAWNPWSWGKAAQSFCSVHSCLFSHSSGSLYFFRHWQLFWGVILCLGAAFFHHHHLKQSLLNWIGLCLGTHCNFRIQMPL